MAVTAIISFTNMAPQTLELVSLESPGWPPKPCNSAIAGSDRTVWRVQEEPMHGGDPSECCNMWVPHCKDGHGFAERHIEIRVPKDEHDPASEPGAAQFYIWQEEQADGDFVRCTQTGYQNPAPPIAGSARVSGNREYALTIDQFKNVTLWDPDLGAEIPGVPTRFLDRHWKWHQEDHQHKHSGEEFLQFHRDFVLAFRAWYDTQPGANPGAVAAWPTLPSSFNQPGDKQAPTYLARVRDLERNLYKWRSVAHLGSELSGSLHLWLHHIPITTVNRDVWITSFATCPKSRHFYQLHGFFDALWRRWVVGNSATWISQSAAPSAVDPGQRFSVTVDFDNTGRTDWAAGGSVKLSSLDPTDTARWGTRRIPLSQSTPQPALIKAPDKWSISRASFTIAATAPSSPGTYSFRWRLVDEAAEWFGDATPQVLITVRMPAGQTKVPDVVGLLRAEAIIDIRAAGLKPAVTGGGTTVFDQQPDSGALVPTGSTVVCRLRGSKPDQRT